MSPNLDMAQYHNVKSSNVIMIPDSPAVKRQKTSDNEYQATQNVAGYDSEDDSGDELFDGIMTPATARYQTQPTQILSRSEIPPSPSTNKSGEIQVIASSPFRPQPSSVPKPPTNSLQNGGRLANLMAPAGTSFRAPAGVRSTPIKKPMIIDISDDDGPQYKGDSSEDDGTPRRDLKPSVFKTGGGTPSPSNSGSVLGRPNGSGISSSGRTLFNNIMANSSYKPGEKKQTSMSNNLGQRKSQLQSRPERAIPVGEDVLLDDDEDFETRKKISRIRAILPQTTVVMIRNALRLKNGNADDAMQLLVEQDSHEISDDEVQITNSQQYQKPEPQMKRQLNVPIKSIQERYSSTQHHQKAQPPLKSPLKLETPPPKPKRRLMKGRRHPSSPAAAKPSESPKPPTPAIVPLSDFDSEDSALGTESEEDVELEGKVLKFLNTCHVRDLADLTSIKEDMASAMLTSRPFRSLDVARQFSDAKPTKNGKKSTKAPIGERIVQTAVDMWSGYEAVDALVAKCEELGKPLTKEMKKWGLDVFGAAKHGELEMVSLEDDNESLRDSGIGTPNSKAASQNGEPDDEDIKSGASKGRHGNFLKKPAIMNDDIVLKDYQLVGLNWLALLYKYKLSCILADDMGLGKTCQIIAFLSHLAEIGQSGPHLVIVPPSTLENWLREFRNFSSGLVVEPYYGSQTERLEIAERILDNRADINVVVSTYDFATKKEDNRFMRQLRPNACIYDEGHVLKNPKSLKYQALVKIPAQFRVLLTGTPLQNNLMELAALLGFILPEIFRERQDDLEFIFKHKASTRDSDHAALLSNQRIARAKSMLTPFVLRRKKTQVLKHMPTKLCRVEYCELLPSQAAIYNGFLAQAREREKLREQGIVPKNEKSGENNPLMQLRKAAIHGMLFRRHFTDEKLKNMLDLLKKHEANEFQQPRDKIMLEMQAFSDFYLHLWCRLYPCIGSFDVPELTCMNSGKVEVLVRLLQQYKSAGDRVLVFSQFTLVLDILEEVLQSVSIEFMRFDGGTRVNERQSIIDEVRETPSITAFLLSTKAGGTGINLMFANKVIIFDSSFNPQDDVQAENRAHRVGQTRDVEVVRLVTRGTIEEQIYALGQSKLALDNKVAGNDEDVALRGEQMVARMLLHNESLETVEETSDVTDL